MNPSLCSTSRVIALAACILLAGIPAAMAADETGTAAGIGATIVARSFPSGAAIYLNDEYRGVTPAILKNISPGEYMVNLSMPGYNNESFTVILYHGSMRELGANLEPASAAPAPAGSGSVAIDSDPGGASVLLDGRPAGKTPAGHAALILNDVPAGSHTVTVELAGYPAYTGTVTVIRNQVVKVSAGFVTPNTTTSGTPLSDTLPASMAGSRPAPLVPLAAVAAVCVAGFIVILRRS